MLKPDMPLQSIPLEELLPNPDQPRSHISPESIQAMAASLKEIGQKTSIKVRPLTEAEKAQHAPALYLIIGGHRRFEGAKAAGLTALRAEIHDLPPEGEDLEAYLDNESEEMSWFDKDLAIAKIAQRSNLPQERISARLQVSRRKLFSALKVAKAMTPESIRLIRENLQKTLISEWEPLPSKNKDFLITESILLVLAALEDPEAVEKGLKVVLDDQLAEADVKKLVAWVQAGKEPEQFNPQIAARSAAAIQTDTKVSIKVPSVQPSHETHPEGAPQATQEPTAAPPHSKSTPAAKPTAQPPAPSMGAGETLGWDLLSGIPLAAPIRAKIKKGERPTLTEALILIADLLWRGLLWASKVGYKLAYWLVKELWKLLKTSLTDIFKFLGPKVYKTVKFVLGLALLIGLVWLFLDIRQYGVFHPIYLVRSKLSHPTPAATSAPTPAPTPIGTAVPTPGTSSEKPAPQIEDIQPQAAAKVSSVPVNAQAVPAKPDALRKEAASPTIQPTAVPTMAQTVTLSVVKKQGDLLSQAGQAAQSAAPAVDVAKKLFGF